MIGLERTSCGLPADRSLRQSGRVASRLSQRARECHLRLAPGRCQERAAARCRRRLRRRGRHPAVDQLRALAAAAAVRRPDHLAPEVDGEGRWAQIAWPDLEPALSTGLIVGSSGEVRVLRAAASIADGRPIDLGDLAAGLDRRALTLLLAAIAHAAGSHAPRRLTYDRDGIARPGDRLPPLVAWPLRE